MRISNHGGNLCLFVQRSVRTALTITAISLFGCNTLQPPTDHSLCSKDCDRGHVSADVDYWNSSRSTIRFYAWLRTLEDDQLVWVREEMPTIHGHSNDIDRLRTGIVLAMSHDNVNELHAADVILKDYLADAGNDTEDYAFAQLFEESVAQVLAAHGDTVQLAEDIESLELELEQEKKSRLQLQDQLNRLKQIEESLLGSTTP
jgi:hypothetical protein